MIEKEYFRYPGSDGVHQIAANVYYKAGVPPKGVIQIVHGMCEYMGRYDAFAGYLAERGWVICGEDHLGHGRTAAQTERGHFSDDGLGAEYLLADVHNLTRKMKERYAGVPYFLFGHSMGSLIARRYVTRFGGELSGFLCCGTLGPMSLPGAVRRIAAREIEKKGRRAPAELLTRLAFGSYNKKIPGAVSPNAWLTRVEEVQQSYDADPLCTFRFTNGAFADLIGMLAEVSRKDWAARVPKNLPIWLLSGEEDPCGDYGKGVKKVASRLRRAGVTEVTLTLYPGARHEILNEIDREKTYRDIEAWCANHAGIAPAE